jgi:hypothetical protein
MITRIFSHSRFLPFAVWGFNLTILWTSYFSQGYKFADILGDNYAWLDDHRGLINWEGYFKISMLRFISYGMDYYWMNTGRPVEITKVLFYSPNSFITSSLIFSLAKRKGCLLPSTRETFTSRSLRLVALFCIRVLCSSLYSRPYNIF